MNNRKPIIVYLIITFALSGICWIIRIAGGDAAAGITSILMWCPAIAALIVRRLYYRGQKILGFSKSGGRYLLLGLLLPILYLGISYGAFWFASAASFQGTLDINSIPMLLILLVSSLVTALGEEIGWRGFLLPELAKIWNVKIAVLVSGGIWAVWHYPLIFAGLYQQGTPLWYLLLLFTVEVILITGILAFLRLKTNSIWPAVIFHASHNFFDQVIFAPLTINRMSAYFVGETGVITVGALAIVLIIIIRKNHSKTVLHT